jgi:hypothetical protein
MVQANITQVKLSRWHKSKVVKSGSVSVSLQKLHLDEVGDDLGLHGFVRGRVQQAFRGLQLRQLLRQRQLGPGAACTRGKEVSVLRWR